MKLFQDTGRSGVDGPGFLPRALSASASARSLAMPAMPEAQKIFRYIIDS
jgi:hypothetical protein